jgi:HD-like signal output (HDOD) protein
VAIPAEFLEDLASLQGPPESTLRLVAAAADQTTSGGEVADILKTDPAVSYRVLSVANAEEGADLPPVASAREAVLRLGVITVLHVAFESHLGLLRSAAPAYNLSKYEMWLHATGAALATREMIKQRSSLEVPRIAPLASLLHDVGKYLIANRYRGERHELMKERAAGRLSSVEAERALFGCDHAEIGSAIALRWRLGEPIARAIALHHTSVVDRPSPLTDAVVVANLIAKSPPLAGYAGESDPGYGQGSLDRLGIGAEELRLLRARTVAALAQWKRTR